MILFFSIIFASIDFFRSTPRPEPPAPPPSPPQVLSPGTTSTYTPPRYGYLGMDWQKMRPIPGHYMNRQP